MRGVMLFATDAEVGALQLLALEALQKKLDGTFCKVGLLGTGGATASWRGLMTRS